MNNRSYFFGGSATLLVFIALCYFVYAARIVPTEVAHITTDTIPATTPEVTPTPPPATPLTPEQMITVDTPLSGALIQSPLALSGSARGNWYFEASFPIELKDSEGKTVAIAVAQAQSEWMTEDFVPFAATLTWASTSTTATSGMLVFKRDNPSGLPEHDAEVTVPVIFAQ